MSLLDEPWVMPQIQDSGCQEALKEQTFSSVILVGERKPKIKMKPVIAIMVSTIKAVR